MSFKLSKCDRCPNCVSITGYRCFQYNDVKKFIRLLKEDVLTHWEELYLEQTIDKDKKMAVKEIWRRIKEQVDKLAGEELI